MAEIYEILESMSWLHPNDLATIQRAARFWSKVDRYPYPGCWLWTASVLVDGYGQFEHGLRAHRVAWELLNGPIPVDTSICHTCDIPLCVNPEHLFLGSQADNSRDMAAKGRARHSKLTPAEVRMIRTSRLNRGDGRRLAARLGVHPQTISRVRTGESWKEVSPDG